MAFLTLTIVVKYLKPLSFLEPNMARILLLERPEKNGDTEVIVLRKVILLLVSTFVVVGCQSFESVKVDNPPKKSAKSAKQLKKENDQWKQIKKDIEVLLSKTDQIKLQKYEAKTQTLAFKYPTSL